MINHGRPVGNIFYGYRFGDVLCEKWVHDHREMIKFLEAHRAKFQPKRKRISVWGDGI
jgi:hypothetical protein